MATGTTTRKKKTASLATRTHNHDEIREWVESHGGRPSVVQSTESTDGGTISGLLRIDFGEKDAHLEEIEWEVFFRIFEEQQLDFLYQNRKAAKKNSYFNKFVTREVTE